MPSNGKRFIRTISHWQIHTLTTFNTYTVTAPPNTHTHTPNMSTRCLKDKLPSDMNIIRNEVLNIHTTHLLPRSPPAATHRLLMTNIVSSCVFFIAFTLSGNRPHWLAILSSYGWIRCYATAIVRVVRLLSVFIWCGTHSKHNLACSWSYYQHHAQVFTIANVRGMKW